MSNAMLKHTFSDLERHLSSARTHQTYGQIHFWNFNTTTKTTSFSLSSRSIHDFPFHFQTLNPSKGYWGAVTLPALLQGQRPFAHQLHFASRVDGKCPLLHVVFNVFRLKTFIVFTRRLRDLLLKMRIRNEEIMSNYAPVALFTLPTC